MGKKISPLNVKAVEKLMKVEGLHAVGDVPGLYLRVVGNSATWILRYSMASRRRDKSMGPCSDMTLAEAREAARELRRGLRTGSDPIETGRMARQAAAASSAKRMTFAQCVAAYLEAHGDGWKNAKHRQQWANTLDTYAGPFIGGIDVALVDTGLVLKVLEPLWKNKTETATRLRGRLESVLAWATTRGYRHGENPARWKNHLDTLLARPSQIKKVEHHAALPFRQIGAFMADLAKMEGMGARALEFAILAAARSGEVRGATWAELDLDARTWTIPAGRMKAGKEHAIPLSDAALNILESLPRMGGTDLVFPGTKGQPLSDMTMAAVLKRMGRGDLTVHGFRSTFRDWAGEISNHPREVIEHALAHQLKDAAEAAYARGTLYEKRRRLMADWARYCGTVQAITGNVVAMRRA